MNSKITSVLAIVVFFFSTISLIAQEKTITGTVTGADDGLTMPGVSIIIVGTQTGASTDFDGKYQITANEGDVLQFNFMGYSDAIVTVGSKDTYNLILQPDALQLEDVVVTALGIKREKKALGYAVQEVKADEITKGGDNNVVSALSGKAAGVQITSSSGAIGSSANIKIRGNKSFQNGTSPLFVIDGTPIGNSSSSDGGVDYGNSAMDIDMDNIESMNILKGASATALYGSRGANGVIMITTKKGTKRKGIGVEFSTGFAWDNVYIVPDFQNKYGQGGNGSEYAWEQSNGDLVEGDPGYQTYKEFAEASWNWAAGDTWDESWGARLDQGFQVVQFDSNKDENGDRTAKNWSSNPDNIRDFYNTGKTKNINVALSGGNENARGRFSISYVDQIGTVPNTDQKKLNIGLNSSFKLTEKLSVDANINFVNLSNDNLPTQGYTVRNPLWGMNVWYGRQVDMNYLRDNYTENIEGIVLNEDKIETLGDTPLNWMTGYGTDGNNPFFLLNQNTNSRERNRYYGNVNINLEITDNIGLMARIGTDNSSQYRRKTYHSGFKGTVFAIQNPANGSFSETYSFSSETNLDLMLNINKKLSKDFNLTGVIGANYRRDESRYSQTIVPELYAADFYSTENAKGNTLSSNSLNQKVTNSLYGSANLSFRNYLFLDLAYRQDWSSTLPKDNWSYGYYSSTLGFIFTDAFEIKSDAFNYGKIRVGIASVGNDTDAYQLEQLYLRNSDVWPGPAGEATLYSISQIARDGKLLPELTSSFETGLEMKFFGNRLGLDLTYYTATTKNQIMFVPIPTSSGFTKKFTNAGKMKNSGIELQLYATILEKENFSWDVTVNYAKNTNEILELNVGNEEGQLILNKFPYSTIPAVLTATVGEAWGTIYAGNWQKNNQGQVLIGQNGMPLKTDDLVQIGDVNPDFFGGIRNTFNFYNFSVSALIDFRVGGDIFSYTKSHGQKSGVLSVTAEDGIRENGMVVDGVYGPDVVDENDQNISGQTNSTTVSARTFWRDSRNYGELSIVDGSFIKFRDFSISYRVPTKYIAKSGLEALSITAYGRNLALLYTHESNNVNIDPEVSTGGGVSGTGLESYQYAPSRTLGFKLNLKF